MKAKIETVSMTNASNEVFRVYLPDDSNDNTFLMAIETEDGHIEFDIDDAEEICELILKVCGKK